MVLENLMYFALGLLLAALGALVLLPAVWRRAVRLTKKRIEEATPMTMAEFRADKDQLRAEFALQTRRLEMNVETLRKRLADQLRDVNRTKVEQDGMDGERARHQLIISEFEGRETTQRQRAIELEKQIADLSQKLRMRERELADRTTQLDELRKSRGEKPHRDFMLDESRLSGGYDADVELLLEKLAETRRELAAARTEITSLSQRPADPKLAATELTAALDKDADLVEAEAHIADAEQRVTSLLAETERMAESEPAGAPLAERLDYESGLADMRDKVAGIERDVVADWGSERIDLVAMRNRLGEVATGVSRLVHALDGDDRPAEADTGESLYERVQKFVGAADAIDTPARTEGGTAVSDRLKALQEIQEGK